MKLTETILSVIIGVFVFFGCLFVYQRETLLLKNQEQLAMQISEIKQVNHSNMNEISKAFQALNERKQDKGVKK